MKIRGCTACMKSIVGRTNNYRPLTVQVLGNASKILMELIRGSAKIEELASWVEERKHVDLVNLDRVRTRDLTKGDKSGDSEANCDRSEGITLRACKMELA